MEYTTVARKLFTADEISEYLGVSRRTVYNWCDKGMPYFEFPKGGARRFDPKDVSRWMAPRKVERTA